MVLFSSYYPFSPPFLTSPSTTRSPLSEPHSLHTKPYPILPPPPPSLTPSNPLPPSLPPPLSTSTKQPTKKNPPKNPQLHHPTPNPPPPSPKNEPSDALPRFCYFKISRLSVCRPI